MGLYSFGIKGDSLRFFDDTRKAHQKSNNALLNKDDKTLPSADKLWAKWFGGKAKKGECWLCGKSLTKATMERGHKKSKKNGGEDTMGNLIPICHMCNKKMGSRNAEEYKNKMLPDVKKRLKPKY